MTIEVEIKSQVPSRAWLENRIRNYRPKLLDTYRHLNHYWQKPSIDVMKKIGVTLGIDKTASFEELVTVGQKPSLRTRCTYKENPAEETQSELIVKYTIGSDSSEHGVQRLEFTVPIHMQIEQLDATLEKCGALLQAKWSREAHLILVEDIEIQVGFSPGYGWIAEFEKRAESAAEAALVEKDIRAFMAKIGVAELAQEKLDKMFAYYNEHWREYYLTQKTFDADRL